MAITSVGSLGTAVATSLTSTVGGATGLLQFNTTQATLAGDYVFFGVAYGQVTTTGGAIDASTLTDLAGNQAFEHARRVHTTANRVTLMGWWQRVDFAMGSGTTVIYALTPSGANGSTITYNEVLMYGWAIRPGAGNTIEAEVTTASNQVSAANGFGSNTLSGLASDQRFYWMTGAKRANSTTAITQSTNFTTHALTIRSRNNASALILRGEHRINTSTGETSNPTLAVSGDAVSLLLAFREVAAGSAFTPVDPMGASGFFGL